MKRLTLQPRRPLGSSDATRRLRPKSPANPLIPQIMPAISFPGIDARRRLERHLAAPGHDLRPVRHRQVGRARVVLACTSGRWLRGSSPASSSRSARSASAIRGPTSNGDTFVQANELNTTDRSSTKSAAFDPTNPTSFLSPGTVDPNLKNDRTREFIVGLQQELMRNLARRGELRVAQLRPVHVDRPQQLGREQLPGVHVRAPTNCGPTARLPAGHLLPRDVAAAVALRPHATSRTATATTTASSSR